MLTSAERLSVSQTTPPRATPEHSVPRPSSPPYSADAPRQTPRAQLCSSRSSRIQRAAQQPLLVAGRVPAQTPGAAQLTNSGAQRPMCPHRPPFSSTAPTSHDPLPRSALHRPCACVHAEARRRWRSPRAAVPPARLPPPLKLCAHTGNPGSSPTPAQRRAAHSPPHRTSPATQHPGWALPAGPSSWCSASHQHHGLLRPAGRAASVSGSVTPSHQPQAAGTSVTQSVLPPFRARGAERDMSSRPPPGCGYHIASTLFPSQPRAEWDHP